MKKFVFIMFSAIVLLVSCGKNVVEEKKPYGAVDIEYDKVEGINSGGPTMAEFHTENMPPIFDGGITVIEEGPPRMDNEPSVEPTADLEEEPDYGGIPVVTRE